MRGKRNSKRAAWLLTFVLLGGIGLAGCQQQEAVENMKAFRQVGINKMNEGDYEGAVKAFQ